MFGWANIRNQNLFVGVLRWEIFFFELVGILDFDRKDFKSLLDLYFKKLNPT
jgi:hypothetical protein